MARKSGGTISFGRQSKSDRQWVHIDIAEARTAEGKRYFYATHDSCELI
jgi:hypothetical protein